MPMTHDYTSAVDLVAGYEREINRLERLGKHAEAKLVRDDLDQLVRDTPGLRRSKRRHTEPSSGEPNGSR